MTTPESILEQYADKPVWCVTWADGNDYNISNNNTWKEADTLVTDLLKPRLYRYTEIQILLQIEDLE